MKSAVQLSFGQFSARKRGVSHGGDFSLSGRKCARPIDPKQAIHIVLRSQRARGSWSLLHPHHCQHIHAFALKTAKRWDVRLYRYANVGNHLHLLVTTRTRAEFRNFLRELSGGIAQRVTAARKGTPLPRFPMGSHSHSQTSESSRRGFWDHLAFTRIVNFGRDFEALKRYMTKNLFESAGVPATRLLAEGYNIMLMTFEPPPDEGPKAWS